MSIVLSIELSWLHGDEREQGHDGGRSTPGGVIVVAAFAVVLVSVTGVGIAIVLWVTGVVCVLDVLSDWLSAVDNYVDSRRVWRGDSDQQSSTRGLTYQEQRQEGADEKGDDVISSGGSEQ